MSGRRQWPASRSGDACSAALIDAESMIRARRATRGAGSLRTRLGWRISPSAQCCMRAALESGEVLSVMIATFLGAYERCVSRSPEFLTAFDPV